MIRVVLFLNFLCTLALANENDELAKTIKNTAYEPNYFGMILGLFTVVALIYLTGYLYQKLIRVKLTSSDENLLKADVLSTTPVGQGRNLHVVKIGNKNILIGATQTNITYITDIDCVKELGGNKDDKSC
ncbi:MAG: FliO/MopB family protein [Candidatus Gastranaerophilales bacterium]|nr:FliO/MopB family protein [Candidatus Gastranaerophilales bacterium]